MINDTFEEIKNLIKSSAHEVLEVKLGQKFRVEGEAFSKEPSISFSKGAFRLVDEGSAIRARAGFGGPPPRDKNEYGPRFYVLEALKEGKFFVRCEPVYVGGTMDGPYKSSSVYEVNVS